MFEHLKILHWPDPRLKKVSQTVTVFDDSLKALVARMLELMRESRGVGLAAPQVGQNLRLFVMNHTGEPADDRVYVNPVLSQGDGAEEGEEGCLSLPKINVKVVRNKTVRMEAQDLSGNPIVQVETGYIPRIWQHEFDHLNGVLLTDKMGPATRLLNRKNLRELEEEYTTEHPPQAKRIKLKI